MPGPEAPGKSAEASAAQLRAKLEKKASSPLDIFREQLSDLTTVPEEYWAGHFPAGFRERIAGEFLAD
eukprot:7851579-Alexandrium_andersonii.AAC.1